MYQMVSTQRRPQLDKRERAYLQRHTEGGHDIPATQQESVTNVSDSISTGMDTKL